MSVHIFWFVSDDVLLEFGMWILIQRHECAHAFNIIYEQMVANIASLQKFEVMSDKMYTESVDKQVRFSLRK
jgi:hypothetical protein